MTTVTGNSHDPVDRLAEDFLDRYRRGERPSLTEYARQFPDVANEVADVIQVMLMMENLGAEQVENLEAPPLPDKLGDYQIVRELGRGGMGVVYEAIQEQLGRHVALKVLPVASLLKTNNLERFRREAKAAARLHHTNIVPVHGVGAQDGIHYYAMQYIQGQGLDSLIKEVKQQRSSTGLKDTIRDAAASTQHSTISGFSSRHDYAHAVARIGFQIADAIAHAHAQGVLHRDIKPSNILLDQEGCAWLSDFGLAQFDSDDQLTGTGDIVGTLRYMAPERFKRPGDARSDIYSLGMTLYELLTLQPAFQDQDRAKLIHQILKEEPASLRKLEPGLPRDLETIVLKAITKEPEHRYQKAEDLAEDLNRFLIDRPVAARRLQWWERSWRWVARNRAITIAAALAFLTLLVGLAMTYWQWRRAEAFALAESDAAAKAEVQRQQAQTNADLAWRNFRAILDGLTNTNNMTSPELKKGVLQHALAMHRQYLSKVQDLPKSYEMARIANDLGLLHHDSGDFKTAQEYYRTAIATYEGILQAQPENQEAVAGCAMNLTFLAKSLYSASQADNKPATEALAAAQKSVELIRPLHEKDPANIVTSTRMIYCLSTLAQVNSITSGPWRTLLQEAGQIIEQLGPLPGKLTISQLESVTACHKLHATLLTMDKKFNEALPEAETAYRLATTLARDYPQAHNLQRLFTECSSILAVVLTNLQKYDQAEKLHRDNVELFRSLLLHDSENATHHSNLGGELNNLAIALGRLDKVTEALRLIDEAIKEQRMALRQFPNHKQYVGFLYNHYKTQTRLHLQVKDHIQAANAARQLGTFSFTKGNNHYEAALYLCRAGDLAAQDQRLAEQERRKQASLDYDQAMAHLKTAIDRGYADKTKIQSQPFHGLKKRQDYQQLLREPSLK
ncbi:MAG: serine/threonine-protein kinase [Gemmatales bacterium]